MGDDGYGRDCEEDPAETGDTSAAISGVFPTVFAGMTLAFFPGVPYVHGFDLAFYAAGGAIPRVRQGTRETNRPWFGAGLNLTLAFGAP